MSDIIKNNAVLTTQELAVYLKLNEKTILKLAQTGEIPGIKIGNQWRFHLNAVDKFMQERILKQSGNSIEEIQPEVDIMPLSRLTDDSLIELDLASTGPEDLLKEITSIAILAGITEKSKELEYKLEERENMLSTAVGNGFAIPHPRNPDDGTFTRLCILIARSVKGIDFNAPDNKKVHLFFMPCAIDIAGHLKLLSKISFLFSELTLNDFMEVKSKPELFRLLLEHERMGRI